MCLLPFYSLRQPEDDWGFHKMRQLTISEWHSMARKGAAVPVRILIKGDSMFPLIRINRDYVTVYPLDEKPEKGDIVMFADQGRQRYVLHRVWKIEKDRVMTWGDNCPEPDGWMPLEMIWGKAALIERGKKTIRPNRKAGLRLAGFWHRVGWIWRLAGRCVRAIRRRIRQVI